jgi:hypothetical protein
MAVSVVMSRSPPDSTPSSHGCPHRPDTTAESCLPLLPPTLLREFLIRIIATSPKIITQWKGKDVPRTPMKRRFPSLPKPSDGGVWQMRPRGKLAQQVTRALVQCKANSQALPQDISQALRRATRRFGVHWKFQPYLLLLAPAKVVPSHLAFVA